jgi:hypothetical protein
MQVHIDRQRRLAAAASHPQAPRGVNCLPGPTPKPSREQSEGLNPVLSGSTIGMSDSKACRILRRQERELERLAYEVGAVLDWLCSGPV